MIAVIVAGGSGTRLWPLSTSTKPKHLLSLTSDLSLLQESYERAKLCADEVYVVTDHSHSDLVREQLHQLPEENLIIEPGRRGTASCIVLALAEISKKHDDNTAVAFFHADHHIQNREGFAETVQFAAESSKKHDAIALIGIHPDYAATGFGYIKVGKRLDGAFEVEEFKEKPDDKTAEKYVASGKYLWNLGLFAGTIGVFKQELQKHYERYAKAIDDLNSAEDREVLSKCYLDLPDEPIDTALIERTKRTIVIPGTFDWADIGSYKDLHEVMPKTDEFRNAIKAAGGDVRLINTKNSMVISHNKPVVVIGLEDVAVVDTPDGILVCHKDHAQEVKTAAKSLQQ